MNELKELRDEIDAVDDALIPLLLRRMEISRAVAEYKIKNHLPVLNQEREQQILDDVAAKCGEHSDAIKTIFSAAMDASRALQHQISGGGEELRELVQQAKGGKTLTADGAPIACQGVDGAYSGEAAAALFPDSPIEYHRQFEDVFEAVNRGAARFGIIPVEAQACGRPVVAYASGGVLETVIDGRTGVFFAEQTGGL